MFSQARSQDHIYLALTWWIYQLRYHRVQRGEPRSCSEIVNSYLTVWSASKWNEKTKSYDPIISPPLFSQSRKAKSNRDIGRGSKSIFWYWEVNYDLGTFREFETIDLAEGERLYQEERFDSQGEDWNRRWSAVHTKRVCNSVATHCHVANVILITIDIEIWYVINLTWLTQWSFGLFVAQLISTAWAPNQDTSTKLWPPLSHSGLYNVIHQPSVTTLPLITSLCWSDWYRRTPVYS